MNAATGPLRQGAAFLAGLGTQLWTIDDLERRRAVAARYEPRVSADEREARYDGWRRAVARARDWVSPSGSARGNRT